MEILRGVAHARGQVTEGVDEGYLQSLPIARECCIDFLTFGEGDAKSYKLKQNRNKEELRFMTPA